MSNVVELDDCRPFVVRAARCVMCDRRWDAAYPSYVDGKINLECPDCGYLGKQIMGNQVKFKGPLEKVEQLCVS